MKKWIYLAASAVLYQVPLMAETAPDMPPTPEQGIWQTAIMIGIFLVFFYFILFRPEQKRRQAADQQRSQIRKGDKVTAMGIIGTVVRIQDNTLILKMYDGSKIQILTAAVTDVMSGTDEDRRKAEKEDKEDSGNGKKIEHFASEE